MPAGKHWRVSPADDEIIARLLLRLDRVGDHTRCDVSRSAMSFMRTAGVSSAATKNPKAAFMAGVFTDGCGRNPRPSNPC